MRQRLDRARTQRAGEEALACFDQALAADPACDRAYFLMSIVLGDLRRHEEAAACVARARELSPGTYG